MADSLQIADRPEGYAVPDWEQVSGVLEETRKMRQPVIDRIWEVKRARRGEWTNVIRKIPKAYRQILPDPDLPQMRDMINRVVGLIQKQEPEPQVTATSPRSPEVKAAANEEARMRATRLAIEDQQDRAVYAMGIDAQAAWGESWTGIYPDSSRLVGKEYERGEDEDADAYEDRYSKAISRRGIPICLEDFDPQTVFPWFAENRLPLLCVETEHNELDLNLGLGYRAKRDAEGKLKGWERKTLSEGWVPATGRDGTTSSDTTHDTLTPGNGSPQTAGKTIKKVLYVDCWVWLTFLDGVEVERWEHNYGFVPIVPAYGEQSSDRDPAWQSAGIADAGLAIAKQLVMFAAVLSANAMQHGFPTPFLKNPAHGLVHPITGDPLVREVRLGEMNLLGPQEEIEFPYLNAQMMPDFFKHLDWLQNQLENTTVSNFGKSVGSDMAGYAIAQIRAMQLSILSTIYTNAARQWRKLYYMLRHIIRTEFPAGIWLPGAIEEDEEGNQFRPILKYAAEHCTDYAIEVSIAEGIPQDEMAENKMALENVQSGIWTKRRAMEKTGVENAATEKEEIAMDRLMDSPAADQQVWLLAMALAAERFQATDEQKSSPFMQELAKAKNRLLGLPGQPENEAGLPNNALPGGQPQQQNPPPDTPLEGGPTTGPTGDTGASMQDFAVPQTPGGVTGVQQVPAVRA